MIAVICLACAPTEEAAGGSTRGAEPTVAPASTGATTSAESRPIQIIEIEVVRRLPHSTRSYTQGLFLSDGSVFESRGRYGESGLDRWNPETGEILQSVDLSADLFGEGIVRVGESVWQLTWQAGLVMRRDLETFEVLQEFALAGEGWGLAYDGKRLIVSDGTHELRFFDPETFEPLGRLAVSRGTRPQDQLNELEWVDEEGVLYANVFQTDEIVRIDVETGHVVGVADLSGLLEAGEARRADVLNGIAFWPERKSFLVTGKYWPASFEVRFSSQ